MNINKVNLYSATSFSGRTNVHRNGGKYGKKTNNTNNVVKTAGGVSLAAATVLAASLLMPSCNSQPNDTNKIPTENIPYVDIADTKPTEEIIVDTTEKTNNQPVIATVITTIPQSERKAVWYEVKSGDRLADIVKEYAELDVLTPDNELVPYYELLENDNPGTWTDRNKILIGSRFRVDSILPENIRIEYVNRNDSISETQAPVIEEEVVPTEESQETSQEDTVNINGNIFTFDLGTTSKNILGDYKGLMFGKFTTLDKKMNGNIELTKYEGTNEDSNKSQMLTYDKDGKIIEIANYQDNKVAEISTYSYKTASTIEETVDKNAKSNQIDSIITTYSNKDDSIYSRDFSVDGKTIASFDFLSGTVQIGETTWVLDYNTFECNDETIGSKKYCAMYGGQEVRFDVLKNGFCVDYMNGNGEIQARQQFDTNGNLIFEE